LATPDLQRNAKFRELLRRPGLLRVPVCSDALSALVIKKLGFEAMGISGSGSIASLLGKPDTGLATATEMAGRARQIADAADPLPVIADADTGYGDLNNVRRTIQDFESAGVSAVHIEDQEMPKKLGSMAGVTVIDAQKMAEKIKIACRSRRDPNFSIIGRTDAYAPHGIDEVIRRCKIYADAGADILYPHNIRDRADLEKLARSVREAPLMHDVVEPQGTLSDQELEDMGFKVVIHGRANILCQAQAVTQLWTYYKTHGETRGYLAHLMAPDAWSELIGNDAELNIRDLLQD
jgi:2-methylisocitrate lyase-like PEP mutase family enzyme